VIWI